MCGFVGIFDSTGCKKIDPTLLTRMSDTLVHRGPDGSGAYLGPGIGLGHRRLAIIDVAGGQQPLFNEDRSVVVVYNGEIYNFKALTEELLARGHRFRTNSDTEVIVHAWEEWREQCVTRFRGMFAFALWDSRTRTLFLARDRLGIKPLYYAALADGTVLFASELKALAPYPDLPRKLDACAVEDYFAYGYVPDPKTIFQHVRKLAPGHLIAFERGKPAPPPRPYWDLAFEARKGLGEAEACEELAARLREAVELRMIADVPLGAFLSGGTDSSSVVAMMAGLATDPVETFSIGFDWDRYDESPFAAQVAAANATRHHARQVDTDTLGLIDEMAGVYDEPFADSSAMPTFELCALARERVTVALSGDGGDELFAGYRRYRWHHYEQQVRTRVPARVRAPLFGFLGAFYPKLDWAPKPFRAKSTFQALARDSIEGYFNSVSIVADGLRERLYSPALRRDLQGYHAAEVLRGHFARVPGEHHLDRVQYVDLKTYLPGDILTKVDRASMAHSLEVRVPMLDHILVEWAAGLAPSLRLKGREGKYVLKKAMEPFLPRNILYRPKMGFAIPLAEWLRGPLGVRVQRLLSDGVMADCGMFDMGFVSTMLERHRSGRRDHSAALWALVMFERFLDSESGLRHGAAALSTEPAPSYSPGVSA